MGNEPPRTLWRKKSIGCKKEKLHDRARPNNLTNRNSWYESLRNGRWGGGGKFKKRHRLRPEGMGGAGFRQYPTEGEDGLSFFHVFWARYWFIFKNTLVNFLKSAQALPDLPPTAGGGSVFASHGRFPLYYHEMARFCILARWGGGPLIRRNHFISFEAKNPPDLLQSVFHFRLQLRSFESVPVWQGTPACAAWPWSSCASRGTPQRTRCSWSSTLRRLAKY